MSADDPCVLRVDFRRGILVSREFIPPDKFDEEELFKDLAAVCDKYGVPALILMTVDRESVVRWAFKAERNADLTMAMACFDDVESQIKAEIFGDSEVE